ncbi:MAG: hypothetical protein Q3997_00635 [Propionibacteriaceae bacterium]|nr:hypothetical protein [Propionibacteriaceae bacterium]
MGEVRCEQLVYTWHPATLHGPAGHGVVLQSLNWPGKLGLPGGSYSGLTGGASAASENQVFCIRTTQGSLFGARTGLGLDGSGRPGNFLCHLMFDPSGQVGMLDALLAAARGQYITKLSAGIRPDGDWEPARLVLPESWPHSLAIQDEFLGRLDDPLRFLVSYEADWLGLPEVYDRLVGTAPASLMNELSLVSDTDTSIGVPSALDKAAIAQTLGPVAQVAVAASHAGVPLEWSRWWRRCAWSLDDWAQQLRAATLALRLPGELSVEELVEVGQQSRESCAEYVNELVHKLEHQHPLRVPAMAQWFADEVLVAAVACRSRVAIPLANDRHLVELVQSGVLGELPTEAVERLTVAAELPPADVLSQMLAHPDFWPALHRAPETRQEEVAAWLLSRGGYQVPDWFIPTLIAKCARDYDKYVGNLPATEAYDRLYDLIGDSGAIEVLTNSGNLEGWALAFARRGPRSPDDLAPLISSFHAIAPHYPGIAALRLTTAQHIRRTKVLVLSLAVLVVVLLVLAVWGLLT